MRLIYKYNVSRAKQTLTLPEQFKVLHVGLDPVGAGYVWIEFDPELPRVEMEFVCLATGEHFDQNRYEHIGTYVDRPYVWHVYRKVK